MAEATTFALSDPIKSGISIALSVALLTLTGLEKTPAAESRPWPTHYEAPAVTWKEGISRQGYTYQTQYYVIVSRSEIGKGRLAEMTKTAESVRGALASFPLPLVPEDTEGAARGAGDWLGLHVIHVYPTHDEYRAAGGPKGSVGVYLPRTGEVAVSLERLIEPKGARSNLEPRQRYRLLVHELVHQAMGERVESIPMWMVEGFAEYFSACQFAPGRYRFDSDARAIIEHFRAMWLGPGGRKTTLPRVATVQKLSPRSWAADNSINPAAAYAKYGVSLLLVHYQLENAKRGSDALATFLKMDAGFEPIAGFPGRFREIPPPQTPLWKDRSPVAVERGLASFWKGKGLELTFVNGMKRKEYAPFDTP